MVNTPRQLLTQFKHLPGIPQSALSDESGLLKDLLATHHHLTRAIEHSETAINQLYAYLERMGHPIEPFTQAAISNILTQVKSLTQQLSPDHPHTVTHFLRSSAFQKVVLDALYNRLDAIRADCARS